MTPAPSSEQGSSGGSRLNVALGVAAVVSLVVVVALALLMRSTYENRADAVASDGLWDGVGSVLTIERQDSAGGLAGGSSRAGEDLGDGVVVEAMEDAPQDEQVRVADQIEAATKMANAFLNLDHDNIEANIETVKSLATGPFLNQYTRAAKNLVDLIRAAKATQTGEVEWAGLVAGDEDSATVVVATNGTVANKETDFEPLARTYRLQLEVDLVDDRWLISDLQYVR